MKQKLESLKAKATCADGAAVMVVADVVANTITWQECNLLHIA
jgi:hypothetical protein